MLDCQLHRDDLEYRLTAIRSLITAAHPADVTGPDISRESRGLAVLLLYASYENLLRTLCATLLDTAANLRVGNRRLQPGLKVFAAYPELSAINDAGPTKVWGRGLAAITRLNDSRNSSINSAIFPNDGTNFRTTQVRTFCEIFGLPDPAPVLREVWSRLDAVVADRNAVAHGTETPDDVGRRYTLLEINGIVDLWDLRWMDFIDWVESAARVRDFYRTSR
jgi:hypothetical protein